MLAAWSFGISLWLADRLFPRLSSNNDEAVYLFQARVFRSGHLTLPAAPYADFFRPWMTSPHDERLVAVFQPVFPAWLALCDRVFGSMRPGPALVAAAAVVLVAVLARALDLGRWTAVVASALFALSPFVVVQSALYLEYIFAVALEMAGLALVFAARGRLASGERVTPHALAAGFVFGVLGFTRPLEAILTAIAVTAYLVVELRHELRRLWPLLARFVVGGLPVVAVALVYNAALTGNPLRFPLWAIGGNNAFGFGQRNIVDGSPLIDVTPLNALKATHQNLRSFPHWLFGSILVVPFALWGLWERRHDARTIAVAGIGVLFPLGYFFYWGNLLIVNGRKQIGPHYYMGLLIPAVLFAAIGLEQAWRWMHRRKGLRPTQLAFVAMATAALVATAIEMPDKWQRNERFTDAYAAEQLAIDDAVATVGGRAVVVVPITPDGAYLLHPRGWLGNDLDLSGDVLYAADRGADNLRLTERPDRRPVLRLQSVETDASPLTFRPVVDILERQAAPSVSLRLDATNPTDAPHVTAYLRVLPAADDPTPATEPLGCVLDTSSRRGASYLLSATVGPNDIVVDGCAAGPLRLVTPARGTLVVGFHAAATSDATPLEQRELRLWYRTTGAGASRAVETITPYDVWRIVPRDKIPARLVRDDDALRVRPA